MFVGIGGRGGAGKSTLASYVEGAQVVSTDEFWDGGGFDLARLRSEVFDPLVAGREARFASWDWDARRPGETHVVEPHGVVVVEGVCALHRMFATWTDMWMPMEERYIERDDPVSCADVVVDGA
jgi:uridine kinase